MAGGAQRSGGGGRDHAGAHPNPARGTLGGVDVAEHVRRSVRHADGHRSAVPGGARSAPARVSYVHDRVRARGGGAGVGRVWTEVREGAQAGMPVPQEAGGFETRRYKHRLEKETATLSTERLA